MELLKTCTKCQQEKPITEFNKNKALKDGHHAHCKPCKKLYDKIYRDRKEYRDKEKLRSADRRLYDWKSKFVAARVNARVRNYEFNITLDDVPIPDVCPLLGIPLVMGNSYRWNKPSIDRIDPKLGYIKGNVWVISVLANTMKSLATKEQLITFAQNVLTTFK